jgi:hypothetical protein
MFSAMGSSVYEQIEARAAPMVSTIATDSDKPVIRAALEKLLPNVEIPEHLDEKTLKLVEIYLRIIALIKATIPDQNA